MIPAFELPGKLGRAPLCWSVADPRMPGPTEKMVAVIQALDGTWHRPFTTLDLSIAPSQDPDNDGPNLAHTAMATVIQCDPTSDGRDLYVEIMDGALVGRKGWVSSAQAESADGIPANKFEDAVIN